MFSKSVLRLNGYGKLKYISKWHCWRSTKHSENNLVHCPSIIQPGQAMLNRKL